MAIVLAWLKGNPHRFKMYVGNRVAQILELIPADHRSHVGSEDNPADCASRGIFPTDITCGGMDLHDLCYNSTNGPRTTHQSMEFKKVSHLTIVGDALPTC